MKERWNLYLDLNYTAWPWPWPDTDWTRLTSRQVATLPFPVDDFTRYSPADGNADLAQVPCDLPRELPQAVTRLAVYHDTKAIYVFIEAIKPVNPLPDLADVTNEDFSCVIPLGTAHGWYFGLNQNDEAIGSLQSWDPDAPRMKGTGVLAAGYAAHCLSTGSSLVGCFRIEKRLFASAARCGVFSFSAGRRCYATAELLSWGSPIYWTPRPDKHGRICMVDGGKATRGMRLHRIDTEYDPVTETGEFAASWRGAATSGTRGTYAGYRDKSTLALNGREALVGISPRTTVRFAVPDGWNRFEALTTFAPPRIVNFQKFSGRRIVVHPPCPAKFPARNEVDVAFRCWHEMHEKTYVGAGVWGWPGAKVYCLCHDGISHAEPYLYARQHLGRDPVYERRIRETCARMLENQQPAGWFPCHCFSSRGMRRKPELGDGGAFANGSVGEGLALAAALLGEKRWLAATIRSADYSWYRWEPNQNYAAFTLWHLAALQERAPQPEWIAKACYYAENFVIRDIGLGGAQDGHNYYSAYGNITLKGLARLLRVLPHEHKFRPVLKDKVIRFTNQILSRQQPSGWFAGRNRKYLGFHHPVPGLFFVLDALPELAADLMPALAAMTRAVIEQRCPDQRHNVSTEIGLTLALAARHVKGRR